MGPFRPLLTWARTPTNEARSCQDAQGIQAAEEICGAPCEPASGTCCRHCRAKELRLAQPKSAPIAALLRRWLDDESGYDEETWPRLKKALDRQRASLP